MYEIVCRCLNILEEWMKRDFDIKVVICFFEEGDLVYLLDMVIVKGKCWKLSLFWKGLGIIFKRLLFYFYCVKIKIVVMVVNYDRFKKCNDRDIFLWLVRYREKFVSGLLCDVRFDEDFEV